ncbi:MAG: F0F1 ATP synthase subunit beta, partial [Bacteroidales bacterium]
MPDLKGCISQIIGPVVDVVFTPEATGKVRLPSIHHALEVKRNDGKEIVLEVQQH